MLVYSCFNDVIEKPLVGENPLFLTSARDLDKFGIFGPCIIMDLDPNNLGLKTYLNGKVIKEDNTSECVFSIVRMEAWEVIEVKIEEI